jgi:phosphoglycerol transferase MdoB-like AlkP superfamily enzyme
MKQTRNRSGELMMNNIEITVTAEQRKQILWWAVFCVSITAKYILFYAMTNQILEVALGSLIWSVWFARFFRFRKGMRARICYVVCDCLVTFLLVADVQYFQYYGDFLRVFQLGQWDEFKKVIPQIGSAGLIPKKQAFLLFLFVFVETLALFRLQNLPTPKTVSKWTKAVWWVFPVLFIAAVWNPFSVDYLSELQDSEALVHRVYKDIEWCVDGVQTKRMNTERNRTRVKEQLEEYRNRKSVTVNPYYGIAKDRNVYIIQVESMSAFLFGSTYQGQEITPVLHSLAGQDSITLKNFYSVIGAGHTSDAEYAVLNGIYPVSEYGVFEQYGGGNTFYALPEILQSAGYKTSAYHGNEADYFNRDVVYPKLGIQNYYNLDNMQCTDVIGWGMSDKELFRKASTHIAAQSGKQFVHMVTLTSHFSYVGADESIGGLEISEEDKGTEFAGYLCAIHYADEAIGTLIEQLKENGDYDNSMIVIYGDHAGMELDSYNQIAQLTGRTYDTIMEKSVPCLIHLPNSGLVQSVDVAASQVDLFPTILDLLGIAYDDTYVAGVDVFAQDTGFVMLQSSEFVTGDNYYDDETQRSVTTGEAQDTTVTSADKQDAEMLYNASKYIIRNDYLKDK